MFVTGEEKIRGRNNRLKKIVLPTRVTFNNIFLVLCPLVLIPGPAILLKSVVEGLS